MIARAAVLACALGGCLLEQARPACLEAHPIDGVNSTSSEVTPWLSPDRDELLFSSNRAGSTYELFRATRTDPSEPFSAPVMFTAGSMVGRFDPFVLDGVLYFIDGSGTAGGQIQAVPRNAAGGFDMIDATNVPPPVFPELGSAVLHPTLTADQLTIVYGDGGSTLMMATRTDAKQPFRNVHQIGFTSGTSTRPTISPDGQTIVFDTTHFSAATMHYQVAHGRRSADDFVDITHLDLGAMQDNDYQPSLHPDGRTIVFTSDRTDHSTYHLYVYCE